jgi:ABC-type uncharacterized transport system permease subunit
MDHNFWLIVLILLIGAAIAGVAVLMFIAALKALGD